ncbi:MAG TPA: hypothetical protein DEO84_09180, partial [candidate division Zixibacteria bacterium]|nr:hypothetical protein [candidate division Zixibacteria bacterium]
DYSYWDEMVSFVGTADSAWGYENIQASLTTYHADMALVFKSNGEKIYLAINPDIKALVPDSELENKINESLSLNLFNHYFVQTESGLLEIRTAPIQPSSDLERASLPQGFFVTGKIWNRAYLAKIERVVQAEISIIEPAKNALPADINDNSKTPGVFTFYYNLLDLNDRPIARLACKAESPLYNVLLAADHERMIYFGISLLAIMLILAFSVRKWVSMPLRNVMIGLQNVNQTPLNQIRGKGAEFDKIEKLVASFFEQKAKLETEIYQKNQAEQALQEREGLLRATLESTNDGILVVDNNGKVTHWNVRFIELWRIPLDIADTKDDDKLINFVLCQLTNPDAFLSKVRDLYACSDISFDTLSFLDGRVFERYSCPLTQAENIRGRVWSFRDITQRKNAEDKLRIFQTFADSAGQGIGLTDLSGSITYSNNSFVKLLEEKSVEDIVGKKVIEYFPEDVRSHFRENILPTVMKEGLWVGELPAISKTGNRLSIIQNIFLIRTPEGQPIYFGNVITDISELKNAEAALRTSEERFRRLVEDLGEGVVIADLDENFSYVNPAAERIFGISNKQVDGINFFDFLPESQKLIILSNNEFRKKSMTTTYEIDILRTDGSRRSLIITGSPLWGPDNQLEGTLGVIRDITEIKQAEVHKRELEEKLERAQRMESLGLLAGGVAHDLNNILCPVVGYAGLLMRELPGDSKMATKIGKMAKAAEDASAVIQDLLTLARRGRYEMQPLEINQVIRQYLESASFENLKDRNPNITISIDLSSTTGIMLGSDSHIAKVIMNLVTNAFEAMPTGGKFTIVTERANINRLYSGFQNIDEGEYVIVRVKDTGAGIADDDIEKIFEPYFSKKKMGRSGSGLGLSVVYGIVKDHKGYYDIVSKVGKGTEFILYFPASEEKLAPGKMVKNEIKAGNETILIVDDSPEQRELASEILANLGYTVHTAENGHQAVLFISKQSVDLIILDMIMEPDFDGLDTYQEILKICPNQKALVVSGFSATNRVQEMQTLGAGGYVKKPYSLGVLAQAIRKELDQRPEPVKI